MPRSPASLLIVDDDDTLRMCLSAVFANVGHGVRTAADGFSALAQLRQEIPDIIVSDLNMPGMSGFEFLSVVRQRFPGIRVVAMSSAVAADGVPTGVLADAFYQKGSGPGSLLQIVEAMAHPERPPPAKHATLPPPILRDSNSPGLSGTAHPMLTCPECLRIFPRVSSGSSSGASEASCIYCAARFSTPSPNRAQ